MMMNEYNNVHDESNGTKNQGFVDWRARKISLPVKQHRVQGSSQLVSGAFGQFMHERINNYILLS